MFARIESCENQMKAATSFWQADCLPTPGGSPHSLPTGLRLVQILSEAVKRFIPSVVEVPVALRTLNATQMECHPRAFTTWLERHRDERGLIRVAVRITSGEHEALERHDFAVDAAGDDLVAGRIIYHRVGVATTHSWVDLD
ncbi:MAG: hypothetical protein WKF81_07230 [Thermomicrobiales bacterium]